MTEAELRREIDSLNHEIDALQTEIWTWELDYKDLQKQAITPPKSNCNLCHSPTLNERHVHQSRIMGSEQIQVYCSTECLKEML